MRSSEFNLNVAKAAMYVSKKRNTSMFWGGKKKGFRNVCVNKSQTAFHGVERLI